MKQTAVSPWGATKGLQIIGTEKSHRADFEVDFSVNEDMIGWRS